MVIGGYRSQQPERRCLSDACNRNKASPAVIFRRCPPEEKSSPQLPAERVPLPPFILLGFDTQILPRPQVPQEKTSRWGPPHHPPNRQSLQILRRDLRLPPPPMRRPPSPCSRPSPPRPHHQVWRVHGPLHLRKALDHVLQLGLAR